MNALGRFLFILGCIFYLPAQGAYVQGAGRWSTAELHCVEKEIYHALSGTDYRRGAADTQLQVNRLRVGSEGWYGYDATLNDRVFSGNIHVSTLRLSAYNPEDRRTNDSEGTYCYLNTRSILRSVAAFNFLDSSGETVLSVAGTYVPTPPVRREGRDRF